MLKQAVFRNERLRRAVAQAPCVCCWLQGRTQAAHIGGLAEGKGGKLKVSDARIAALCTVQIGALGCHEKFDLHQIPAERGWEFIAKTYIWLVENGYLKA